MSGLKVYYSKDCDRSVLKDQRIAVVGYGSQGRAFALNLRDSGCDVSVVLRRQSKSRDAAVKDGAKVAELADLVDFDVIILALPDHEQPALYEECFASDDAERNFCTVENVGQRSDQTGIGAGSGNRNDRFEPHVEAGVFERV